MVPTLPSSAPTPRSASITSAAVPLRRGVAMPSTRAIEGALSVAPARPDNIWDACACTLRAHYNNMWHVHVTCACAF